MSQAPLPLALAQKNLGRLWRHVAKRERDHGAVLSRTDRLRFLLSYGVPRDELSQFAAAVEAAAELEGLGHRFGWWLERRLGRGVDHRAARG